MRAQHFRQRALLRHAVVLLEHAFLVPHDMSPTMRCRNWTFPASTDERAASQNPWQEIISTGTWKTA